FEDRRISRRCSGSESRARVSAAHGLCTGADSFWTEGAPLRRKAIRSLTNRLNVPVVRGKVRAQVRAYSQDKSLRLRVQSGSVLSFYSISRLVDGSVI